jgi:hypothetical protein
MCAEHANFCQMCENEWQDVPPDRIMKVIHGVKSLFNSARNLAALSDCHRRPRNEPGRSGNTTLILKSCVACGLILGTLLLAQMMGAYRFVSSDLVQREAQRETNRKIVAIEQMARVLGAKDTQLSEIVNETAREAPTQVAWLRILQRDGTPIAAVGAPAEKLYSPSRMQHSGSGPHDRNDLDRPAIRAVPSREAAPATG